MYRTRQITTQIWLQVVLASVAMVLTIPGRTHGLGLITELLLSDPLLSLDRLQYAWLNLLATLSGAVFAVPCGWLIDQFGIKMILVFNVFFLGFTTWFFAQTTATLAFFAGMVLMRGLGQSALTTSSLSLIGKWVPHRLSVAMAAFGIFSTIGFAFLFMTVGSVANSFGWRWTWSYLGLATMTLAIVFQWVCKNPALLCENDKIEQHPVISETRQWTWREAMCSPIFWMFALSCSLFNWVSSGIGLFNQDVLAELGFSAEVYQSALGLSTLVTLLSNGMAGWVAIRWTLTRLMTIGMLMLSACLFTLPFMTIVAVVYLNAVFLGISAGIVIVVFFTCWGQCFGTAHLGMIQGTAQALTVLSSALGPVSMAISKEYYGSYQPLFIALASLSLFSAFLFMRVKLCK